MAAERPIIIRGGSGSMAPTEEPQLKCELIGAGKDAFYDCQLIYDGTVRKIKIEKVKEGSGKNEFDTINGEFKLAFDRKKPPRDKSHYPHDEDDNTDTRVVLGVVAALGLVAWLLKRNS